MSAIPKPDMHIFLFSLAHLHFFLCWHNKLLYSHSNHTNDFSDFPPRPQIKKKSWSYIFKIFFLVVYKNIIVNIDSILYF